MHGLPEKNAAPLPVRLTVPVGGADDAESLTVAVHVVGLPVATGDGVQASVVLVGSIGESTATSIGPPGSLMKLS